MCVVDVVIDQETVLFAFCLIGSTPDEEESDDSYSEEDLNSLRGWCKYL